MMTVSPRFFENICNLSSRFLKKNRKFSNGRLSPPRPLPAVKFKIFYYEFFNSCRKLNFLSSL